MIKTIFVVVKDMEEAEDFQSVEVLQHRAFTDESKANEVRDKYNADFGDGYSTVPLILEDAKGTVNVVETVNGVPQSLRAFFDNEPGNKEAEDIFRRLVNEHVAGSCDVTEDDMETFLEDGVYDDGQGYCLFLTHSTE